MEMRMIWDEKGRDHGGLVRNCPLCGNPVKDVMFEISYLDLNQGKRPVSVFRCTECDFIYKDFVQKDPMLDVKKNHTDRYSSFQSDLIDTYHDRELDLLQKFMTGKERVLDIGCNDGALLQKLQSRFPQMDCCGIEVSEACCRRAAQKGIRVLQGSIFDDWSQYGDSFDVVIISQVLEHLPDLKRAVSIIHEFLKIGGGVFVSVPDDGNRASLPGNMPSILSLEHMNHFSKRSLCRLFTDRGFEALAEEEIPLEDGRCYIMAAMFRKGAPVKTPHPAPPAGRDNRAAGGRRSADPQVEGIRLSYTAYLDERRTLRDFYRQKLQSGPYVIWGASHMAMDFIGDVLDDENLKYIVDSDQAKQGGFIGCTPVVSPERLFESPEYKLVVLPITFERDIVNKIKSLKLPNEVICKKGEDSYVEQR